MESSVQSVSTSLAEVDLDENNNDVDPIKVSTTVTTQEVDETRGGNMEEDDFGEFESTATNAAKDEEKIFSDDPLVQKFTRMTRTIFAKYIPTNNKTWNPEEPGATYALSDDLVQDYLAEMKKSLPVYTPDDYSKWIQDLKSQVGLNDENHDVEEDSSIPVVTTSPVEPYIYTHFSQPWGQIFFERYRHEEEEEDDDDHHHKEGFVTAPHET